jgi:hypothetical protein
VIKKFAKAAKRAATEGKRAEVGDEP